MRRLTDTDGLSDVQKEILRTVQDFVDAEVLPVATGLDHADAYPDKIVERLKELGVFGLMISERYGGLGESLLTYALVAEELSRGWMSLELAIGYARTRQTFGKPIAEHQAITFKLAEMATKTVAAHQMMVLAARRKDGGGQTDVEAGMAKYLAAEYCKEVVEDAFRIHGGYGYSSEYEIERLYRDAPMLLIGEGTSEIQKMIIGQRLVAQY
jgi:alkylation response protein AidB-like acyl-CoA dehydrogenase